jgi:dTDP-4-dehydrorhamnose 3,5-epimerase
MFLSRDKPIGRPSWLVARLRRVEIVELTIPGAYSFAPAQHVDDRGVFMEWYRFEGIAAIEGAPFVVKQANLSVSARGVLRGIHFAITPPGQAKYVTVVAGAALDFVVDLRVGSRTFGQWASVLLDDVDRRAVYVPSGLGHAFVALSESTSVCYLASEVFAPDRELSVNPLDPEIALDFPDGIDVRVSERDRNAPMLSELKAAGVLPVGENQVVSP